MNIIIMNCCPAWLAFAILALGAMLAAAVKAAEASAHEEAN